MRSQRPRWYQGSLSFDNAFFPGITDVNVMGMLQYHDGRRATGNDVDQFGSPVSKIVFDTHFEIDDIQVAGLDGNGKPILVGGGIRLKTDDGSLLMSAALSDLMADHTLSDPIFEGTLTNVQFSSLAGSSTLLTEWSQDIAAGMQFRIGFDPDMVSESLGFAESTALSVSSHWPRYRSPPLRF